MRNPAKGLHAIGIPRDVTSSAAVADMVIETMSQLSPHTLMVLNASITPDQPTLSVTEKDINSIFGMNFKGTFNCYSQASQQMIV